MSDIYQKTIDYVNRAFQGKNIEHFERTVYWVEQWMPNVSDVHRVAAYGHDIERGFRLNDKRKTGYLDDDFLTYHQEEGARLMRQFCLKNKTEKKFAEQVAHLISRHEIGGDQEQDILRDADSVSFMETNANFFIDVKAEENGYQKVKEKIDWMYKRIGSQEARDIATHLYQEIINKLEKRKDEIPA